MVVNAFARASSAKFGIIARAAILIVDWRAHRVT